MGTTEHASHRRRADLAKIHMAKKALALDDDSYRLAVRRASRGRTDTSANLTAAERGALLDHFKSCGFRPRTGRGRRRRRADTPQDRKARALWRSLWNLAEVRSGDDAALDAFVLRQTGIAALAWTTPADKNAVIEALKDWCGRAGFAVPETKDGGREAMERLIDAQWAALYAVGAARERDVGPWLHDNLTVRHPPRAFEPGMLDDAQLEAAVNELGRWVRRVERE